MEKENFKNIKNLNKDRIKEVDMAKKKKKVSKKKKKSNAGTIKIRFTSKKRKKRR